MPDKTLIVGPKRSWLWRAWWEARGVPYLDLFRWMSPELFSHHPPECIFCGRREMPNDEVFIPVFGCILGYNGQKYVPYTENGHFESRSQDEGPFVWHNEELGLDLPTGSLDDHIRYLCPDHDFEVHDVQTGCIVKGHAPTPKERVQRALDALWHYWPRVLWRFLGSILYYMRGKVWQIKH